MKKVSATALVAAMVLVLGGILFLLLVGWPLEPLHLEGGGSKLILGLIGGSAMCALGGALMPWRQARLPLLLAASLLSFILWLPPTRAMPEHPVYWLAMLSLGFAGITAALSGYYFLARRKPLVAAVIMVLGAIIVVGVQIAVHATADATLGTIFLLASSLTLVAAIQEMRGPERVWG